MYSERDFIAATICHKQTVGKFCHSSAKTGGMLMVKLSKARLYNHEPLAC